MKKIISLCLTLCLLLLALPVQAQAAKINYKAFTLVTGFTETLEIDNYAGKVTWKSSKPRVAKVSKDGVVTAKAKGKATITGTLDDKNKTAFTCTVTVINNIYSDDKLDIDRVSIDETRAQVYSVTFDKKHNLVIRYQIANKCRKSLTKHSIIFKFVDPDENEVMTAKVNKRVSKISYRDVKSFRVTIPKEVVDEYNLNLTNCTIRSIITPIYS